MLGFLLLSCALSSAPQEPQALPAADERYKVDILVVVAHPDDEGAATPYLARALDEHKRVAVVFGTRGSSGANEAGAEQAAALGAIREIEARNAPRRNPARERRYEHHRQRHKRERDRIVRLHAVEKTRRELRGRPRHGQSNHERR